MEGVMQGGGLGDLKRIIQGRGARDIEGGVQGRGLCDREHAPHTCIMRYRKISKRSIG